MGCLGIVVGVGAFDIQMTAEGLKLTHLVLDRAYGLDQAALAGLLASIIFGTALVVEIGAASIPFRHMPAGVRINLLVAALGWMVCQATDGFFHVVMLTNQAQGTGIEQALANDASRTENRIIGFDNAISRTFDLQISNLKQHAEDAAEGKDETRVRRCGDICQRYTIQARSLEDQYNDLRGPLNLSIKTDTKSGTASVRQYQTVALLLDLLTAKAKRFSEFCKQLGKDCEDTIQAIRDDPGFVRLRQAYGGGQVLERSQLVVRQVYASMKSIFEAKASIDTVMIYLIGGCLLPALKLTAIIMARCFLWLAANQRYALFRAEIEQDDRLREIEDKLLARGIFREAMAEAHQA